MAVTGTVSGNTGTFHLMCLFYTSSQVKPADFYYH